MPEIFGAGAALFDMDGDGDLDVLAVQGGEHGRVPSGSPARESGEIATHSVPAYVRHRLWSQGADGTFTPVVDSGLEGRGYGMGVAVGDLDGDGLDEVFISAFGGDRLFKNLGHSLGGARFADVTEAAGLTSGREDWSASALFFDVDGDLDLDLFVVRYLAYSPPLACSDQAGRPDYCGPGAFAPVLDRLWRNDGDLRFTDVSEDYGLDRPGKGLGAVAADFDRDGRLDLYVANDGEPNHLWLQEQPGRFVERAVETGSAVNALGRPEAGMGVALGDVDGDGLADLLVSHLRTETHTLYRADERLGFLDATMGSGLGGPSLPFTGFGAVFADLDLDGDLDALISNGAVTRNPRPAPLEHPFERDYAQAGSAFENVGGRFKSVSSGHFTDRATVGRALVRGDIDDDGDVDLVQSSSGGRLRIYLNDSARDRSWAQVQLRGPAAEHSRIEVRTGERIQTRTLARGQSYLSSHDPRFSVGLGDAKSLDQLEVRWRDGRVSRFRDLPVNRRLVLHSAPASTPSPRDATNRSSASPRRAGASPAALVALALFTAKDDVPAPDLSAVEAPVRELIESRRQAVLEQPTAAGAWGELGMAFDVHDFDREADIVYSRAIQLDPERFEWAYFRALILAQRADPETSSLFEQAMALNDRYAPLLVHFGDWLLERGEGERAEQLYRRVLDIDGDGLAHAFLGLARLALMRGQVDAAVEQAERAVRIESRHGPAHGLLAELYRRQGETEKAEQARRRAQQGGGRTVLEDRYLAELMEQGRSSYWHHQRGQALLASRRPQRAEQEFRAAIALAPHAQFHDSLARALLVQERWSEAEQELRRALGLAPDSASSYLLLGRLYARVGDPEKAIPELRRAIELRPDSPAIRDLGEQLLATGRRAEGIAWLERSLSREEDPRVLLAVAFFYATTADDALRDSEKAERLSRRLLELAGDRAESWDALGAALAGQGRFDEAVEAARRAYRLARGRGSPMVFRMQQRLRLYQAGEAFIADR